MFDGRTSRCAIPRLCRYARPSLTCANIAATVFSGRRYGTNPESGPCDAYSKKRYAVCVRGAWKTRWSFTRCG
jgi:hypothetical protein